MILYIRLLRVLLKLWFNPKQGLAQPAILTFRVWPWDCDINRHLNNARYLSFMDLGRVYLQDQLGLFKIAYQRRWAAVIHAIDMTFIRAIPPFAKIQLVTQLIGWDEKYVYLEQRFQIKGHVYAVGLVKGLIIKGRQKIPTAEVFAAAGFSYSGSQVPDVIQHWLTMKTIKKKMTRLWKKI